MPIGKEPLLKNVVKALILFPCAIIFSIVSVLVLLASLFIMFIPLYLYKKSVILVAKSRMPGSKILAVLDNILAKGNVYLQRDQYIVVQWDFEGKLDVDEFLNLWETRVLQKKGANGKTMFPELKCYIETWGGYSFFREDKSFELDNHVKLYESPVPNAQIDCKKLAEIKKKFLHELFENKRSPWQILIVHKYRKEDGKEYSVILQKMHHALGDAYSGLFVFWKCLLLQQMDEFNIPKSSQKQNVIAKMILTVSSCFDCFWILFRKSFQFVYDQDALFDMNAWHTTEMSERLYCAMKPMETSLIKEVSKAFNVSVTTTLLGISSGALRRMMSAKGVTTPEYFNTAYSLPLPNHPQQLKTHATATEILLNIQNPDDIKRLKLIEEELKRKVRAALFVVAPFGKFLLKSFPFSRNKFAKPMEKAGGSTMFIATIPFPAPTSPDFIFQGCRLDACYSLCEVILLNITASVNIVKYKEFFFFNYGIQKHVLKDEDEIYDIEKYVWEELHHLRTSIIA